MAMSGCITHVYGYVSRTYSKNKDLFAQKNVLFAWYFFAWFNYDTKKIANAHTYTDINVTKCVCTCLRYRLRCVYVYVSVFHYLRSKVRSCFAICRKNGLIFPPTKFLKKSHAYKQTKQKHIAI